MKNLFTLFLMILLINSVSCAEKSGDKANNPKVESPDKRVEITPATLEKLRTQIEDPETILELGYTGAGGTNAGWCCSGSDGLEFTGCRRFLLFCSRKFVVTGVCDCTGSPGNRECNCLAPTH